MTRILARIQDGETTASLELWPLVYDELKRLASYQVESEPAGVLGPTALVHEAYLRLVDVERAQYWTSRGHFFAAAAEAMRRILVDHARSRNAWKRGGKLNQIDLEEGFTATESRLDVVLQVDEALAQLEGHDPLSATLVKLRFFAGMSHHEAATAMGISRRTADRLWVVARTWLYRSLRDGDRSNDELGESIP